MVWPLVVTEMWMASCLVTGTEEKMGGESGDGSGFAWMGSRDESGRWGGAGEASAFVETSARQGVGLAGASMASISASKAAARAFSWCSESLAMLDHLGMGAPVVVERAGFMPEVRLDCSELR